MKSKGKKKASLKSHSKSKDVSKEAKSNGGCRKFLCDILTLRVLGYVMKQPSACTYIVTLFIIAGCLPFIGLNIANQQLLPDLDAMQNWNAYIGKLGQENYCFKVGPPSKTKNQTTLATLLPRYPPFNDTLGNSPSLTTCVGIEFSVKKELLIEKEGRVKNILLIGNYNGSQIGTQIKNNNTRIDDQIYVHFLISSTSISNVTASCPGAYCTLDGRVLITAPPTATPTRLPQVHEDFTFGTKVFNCKNSANDHSTRCPLKICTSLTYNQTITPDTDVAIVTKLDECGSETSQLKIVQKHKFGAKVNGIIKIFLSIADQNIAAYHMYLAAIAVATLSLTFTLGIILTDRPSVPKPSLE